MAKERKKEMKMLFAINILVGLDKSCVFVEKNSFKITPKYTQKSLLHVAIHERIPAIQIIATFTVTTVIDTYMRWAKCGRWNVYMIMCASWVDLSLFRSMYGTKKRRKQ